MFVAKIQAGCVWVHNLWRAQRGIMQDLPQRCCCVQ